MKLTCQKKRIKNLSIAASCVTGRACLPWHLTTTAYFHICQLQKKILLKDCISETFLKFHQQNEWLPIKYTYSMPKVHDSHVLPFKNHPQRMEGVGVKFVS